MEKKFFRFISGKFFFVSGKYFLVVRTKLIKTKAPIFLSGLFIKFKTLNDDAHTRNEHAYDQAHQL